MALENPLRSLYKDSLSLLTDFYELTMAYGYWKKGLADRESVFHLCFRKKPFNGGFAVAAGLGIFMEFMENFHYSASDLAYLSALKVPGGEPLFEEAFLDLLEPAGISL